MCRWLGLCCVLLALSGCSLYRPELQQGDNITQASLDNLKVGQSKHQVQEIMGTPALVQVFEVEQWHYTYAYLPGKDRSDPLDFKTLTLYFKNDQLHAYSSSYWHPVHLPQKTKKH